MDPETTDGTETAPVALVTGGAVRLGRSLALALARAGHDVAVHYGRSRTQAHSTGAEIEALGRSAHLVQADLSDPEAPDRVIEETRARFGRLDVLVNAAATFYAAPLTEVDAAAWDAAMDVNVRAPHLLVRAAAPLLREARGAVVNIVDLSAFQPWTEFPHHAVSKAALAHLTRVQARALAPEIRVNAVAPGAVLPPDGWAPERLEALRARTPLGLGSPEDVADAVLYLVGARYVTGQILAVDGGRLLGPAGPPTPEGDEDAGRPGA